MLLIAFQSVLLGGEKNEKKELSTEKRKERKVSHIEPYRGVKEICD